MPIDKNKCVEYKNKLYCYNSSTGKIDGYKITSFDIEKCPTDVIAALMFTLSEAERKPD